jgi:hypothetical protein
MTRPKAPKGQSKCIRVAFTPELKFLLMELVNELGTSQADIFRQATIYLGKKHEKNLEKECPLFE